MVPTQVALYCGGRRHPMAVVAYRIMLLSGIVILKNLAQTQKKHENLLGF